MRSRLFLLLLPAVFVFSCTIEKRLHRPGYHIEWKKHLHAQEKEPVAIRPSTNDAVLHSNRAIPSDSVQSVAVAAEPEAQTLPEQPLVSHDRLQEKKPILQRATDERSVRAQQNDQTTAQTVRAKPRAVVVILAAVWFIVAALLLIAGISLISGSPVWGIILLVLAGIMLILPLLGVVGGGSKKSSAGFAPMPEPRFRYRFRMKPDKDMQRKAVIVFILIVLYILLAILGVIFGISMITSGTLAVGILLLVLGGLMLLIPAITLILVGASGEK